MPPCHGGDRGFDPRLVRHVKVIDTSQEVSFLLSGLFVLILS